MNFLKTNLLAKYRNNSILLEELAEKWLLYKKHQIKNSTYYRYQYLINKYILPYFKSVKINFFEGYDFNLFIDDLSIDLSIKSAKDIVIVLKSILKYAEIKYNYNFKLDLISMPRYETKEIKILNKREKTKLENFCYNNASYRAIGIVVCLNTGIRIGEICALKWENINLEKNILIIDKSLQRIYKDKKDTIISIDEPKSKKSKRKIPISNKLHKILKEIKVKNKFKGDEYFLTGSKYKYIEPRNYQYILKKYLKECKLKNYKFHILRHTFATECIEIGMDIKSLSEILGHANVDITLNKYIHSSFSTKKKFLEKL